MQLFVLNFVPSNISPLKETATSYYQISNQQRLELVKSAINEYSRFKIDLIEIVNGGISYTIDTIRHFKEVYPNEELYLLIGGDQALKLKQWNNYKEIFYLTKICIAARIGASDKKEIMDYLEMGENGNIYWIDAPITDLASSEIRAKIVSNQSIKGMVPLKVEEQIISKRLYLPL